MFRITTGIVLWGLFNLLLPSSAWAQPSLDEHDTTTVTVTIKRGDGKEEVTYQVYRDGRRREQYYYMPDAVRLFERDVDGKRIPQFTLIKYDFTDQNDPNAPKGGILQFAATMGAPPEAIEQLKAKIPNAFKLGKDEKVQLAAMPIKQARVALYAAKDGKLVSATFGEGAAPLSDTQRMIFQLDLAGEAGVGVIDAMTKEGQGGIGVAVTIDFFGLTPAAKVKIVADYRRIAKHYSFSEKTKVAAAASGFFGLVKANAEYQKSLQDAVDDLKKVGALDVEVDGSEKLSAAELTEKFVAPTLARINQQILEVQKDPEKIAPAEAKDPVAEAKAGGWGFAAAYGKSVAIKKIEDIKEYRENIEFRFRDLALRQTTVAGFVGVGNYPKEVRDPLYITATRQFETAILRLPLLSDDDFTNASMETWVIAPSGNTRQMAEVHSWLKGAAGWTTSKDKAANYAQFSFTTRPQELKGQDWTKFKLHYEFTGTTAAKQKVKWQGELDALNGATKLTGVSPESHHVFDIDWSGLTWATSNVTKQPGEVSNLTVQVEQGGGTLASFTVSPFFNGQLRVPPPTSRVFCPVGKGAVSVKVTAIMYDDNKNPVRRTWASTEDLMKQPGVTPIPSDFGK